MSKTSSAITTTIKEAGKLIALVVLLIALMLWLSGTFVSKIRADAPPASGPPAPAVKSQPVELRQFPLLVEQVGTVQTRAQAQVAARVMAQVLEVPAHEGQAVTGADGGKDAQPTVLARLDARDIEAKLKQAQTQVAAAEQAQTARSGAVGGRPGPAAGGRGTDSRPPGPISNASNRSTPSKLRPVSRWITPAARRDVAEAQALAAVQQVNGGTKRDRPRGGAEAVRRRGRAGGAGDAESYDDPGPLQRPRLVRKMIDVGDMVAPGQPLFVIETSGRAGTARGGGRIAGDEDYAGAEARRAARDARGARRREPSGRSSRRPIRAAARCSSRSPCRRRPSVISGQFGTLAVPTGTYQALVVPTGAVRQVGQLHLVDVRRCQGRSAPTIRHPRAAAMARSSRC